MTVVVRVLHVEDDPHVAALTARFLERERPSFDVTSVRDARTGLDHLAEEPVDCIVSDYEMPGIDGLELLRRVREDHPDLPFVLFTSRGSEAVASDAISAGVTDYLRKGVGAGDNQYVMLANRIANSVETYRTRRVHRRRAEAIEALTEGVALFDRDGRFAAVDEAYADLYGYDRGELVGEPWTKVKEPDEVERLEEDVLPDVRVGEPWEGRTEGLRADGSTFSEQMFATTLEDGSGVAVVRDRSQQAAYEATLAALHDAATGIAGSGTVEAACERTVAAAEGILEFDYAVVLLAGDGRFEPVSLSADLPPSEVEPPAIDEGVAGETLRRGETILVADLQAEDEDVVPDGYRAGLSVPIGDDGVFQAVATTPGVLDETDADLAEVLVTHLEQTLFRIRAHGDLREERDRFASLFRNVPAPAARYEFRDGEPVVRAVNAAFESVFGYDAEAATGRSINDLLVPPDDHSAARSIDERVRRGERVEAELRRETAEGELRDFRFQSVPLMVEEGGAVQGFCIYVDVTERRRHERALEAERERYRRLVEASPAPMVIFDEDERLVYANESLAALVGVGDLDELYGESVLELVHPADRELVGEYIDRVLEEREVAESHELRLLTDDGDERDVLIATAPITYGGAPAGQSVLVDVTEQREHARELERQNERLETFRSYISHDLQSPLNVAMGRVELAGENHDGEHLEMAAEALDRLATLVEDLLLLAEHGQGIDSRERVNVGALAEACWRTIETGDARLVIVDDETVRADESRLRELVENLFRNAIEHGSTSPRSAAHEDAVEHEADGPRDSGGAAVTIRIGPHEAGFFVEDDGPGIPPGERDRVFDSGYTTTTTGSGLGLTIVREIADAHGWDVRIARGSDGGTRFVIDTERTAPVERTADA